MQQSGTSPPDVDVLNRLLNGAPGIRNWTGPTEHTSGDLVGHWRLTERLGAGAIASVWMAERIDGMLGRPAAIKLPSEGWYGRSFALRLEREREILGGLAHPNIA